MPRGTLDRIGELKRRKSRWVIRSKDIKRMYRGSVERSLDKEFGRTEVKRDPCRTYGTPFK